MIRAVQLFLGLVAVLFNFYTYSDHHDLDKGYANRVTYHVPSTPTKGGPEYDLTNPEFRMFVKKMGDELKIKTEGFSSHRRITL